MKTKVITALAVLGVLATASRSEAAPGGPLAVVTDVVAVRPACLAVTAVGTAVFVAVLPFAALSKSVKKTGDTLVVKPAKATFTRPLGDLDALRNYPEE